MSRFVHPTDACASQLDTCSTHIESLYSGVKVNRSTEDVGNLSIIDVGNVRKGEIRQVNVTLSKTLFSLVFFFFFLFSSLSVLSSWSSSRLLELVYSLSIFFLCVVL
jgi:hypothetical protein